MLLGTAAGFAMAAGAQAADLGDNAEPVQFVKICPRDGHSYYYIPGNGACQNGLSLTIGTDDRRSKSLMNLTGAGMPNFGARPGSRQGEPWSDPFISLAYRSGMGLSEPWSGARTTSMRLTPATIPP